MAVKYAMLEILRQGPQTGYGLKKKLNASPVLHWQEDENSIYKTLTRLVRDGAAASEVRRETGKPAGKVYFITESGLSELKKWAASLPEPPRANASFLIRLASAELLEKDELIALFDEYEKEIKIQLLMLREGIRRESADSGGHGLMWEPAMEYALSACENELRQLENLRKALEMRMGGERNGQGQI